jgi:CubicO group peptidase (beta-lactamase class C family)
MGASRIACGVLAAWAACAAPPAVLAAPKKPPPALSPLGQKIDEAVQAKGGAGLWGSLLVAVKGEVVIAKGYGFADYAKRPNAPDTIHELASASKQVTATAILRLEQQKKLKTSDDLTKFFKGAPKDKKKVTVQHLLNHTSGLSPELGVPYASTIGREAYGKQMLEPPLVAEPGTKWAYSNVGYALLAAIVEEVTGRTFEEYVHKELFGPAGLSDTGFIQEPALVKSDRVSSRVNDDGHPEWTAANWWYGWGYRGMGGVVTTVLDVLKWDRALRGDKVLGAAAKAKLYTPALENYACGWEVRKGAEHGNTKVSHSGGVRGYGCLITRWLEDDVIVVWLSNGKGSPYDVVNAIVPLLFP